ncbi:MAG: tetratricopeptide repeat protein [Clostridiales bacterium]|nr:tetratricopeptide repeat protein [Clostridiales bacterium]
MSLLLCRQEHVTRPFYAEELGIRLYSSQELCYVSCHYPLLVMDGFLSESLLDFLREELNHGFLALKIERWLKSGENPDEALVMILQESDYCTGGQINRFRQTAAGMRKKHPAEYKKLRADEFFQIRQYGRAEKLYRELADWKTDAVVDDRFRADVLYNLGSCYARMFRLEKAFDAYRRSFAVSGRQDTLSRLYMLSKLNPELAPGERLKTMMTEELRQKWDADMETARRRAAASEQVGQLETLFRRDPIRRREGEEKLVARWKQEYRMMV